MQDFRRLQVWQKAHALAIDVFRVTGAFPRRVGVPLVNQLRRAALSVPANIAEGAGKATSAEFHRFLQIAMGSASEAEYHLLVARDLGALNNELFDDLCHRMVEVRRMLVGLAKRVSDKHPAATRPANLTSPLPPPSNSEALQGAPTNAVTLTDS